ncbi:MAG: RNA polymerase sigma factor [Chthoniobacterales bacterium]
MAEGDTEQLVEKFYAPLYRFGLSLSRKEADASDLVQQTFCTWAAKGHQLRDKSKVKTWLFTTLYRDFLATKRHDARFVETENEADFAEPMQVASSVVDALDAAIVQKALQALDERYRAPVTLFYMQQHSYREIAEILAIPIGTVMSRISRGKADLRKGLSDTAAFENRKIVSMEGEQARG